MMRHALMIMAAAALGLLVQADAQAAAPTSSPTPAPAPAPAPAFVNVTQLLVYGGAYSTFIDLMIQTKVDVIFQGMANNSQSGITIFAPTDAAFQTKLAATLLKPLNASQKVSLVEYHALTAFKSLQQLQNSDDNQTTTLASFNNGGGRYMLNISFGHIGVVQVTSDWTTANISSTIYSQDPVSIFAIDEVLLPSDLFGLPSPAPAPAPSEGEAESPTLAPSPSESSSTSSPTRNNNSNFAVPSFAPSSLFSALLVSAFSLSFLTSTRL